LIHGAAEHDGEVFGGVVAVDLRVAGRAHHEVEAPVARELVEHVGEEGERRLDVGAALARRGRG
jgi:hypothetical protein